MKTFWRGIPSFKTFTVNYHNQIRGILDIKQGQKIQIRRLDQNVGLWEILVFMICLIKSSLKFNFRTKRKISFKFLQQFEAITELTFVKTNLNDSKQLTTQPKPAHVQKKEFDGRFVLITIKHILQTCETKQSIPNTTTI